MAQVIRGEFGAAGIEPADATADVVASMPQKTHSVAALNLGPKPGEVGDNLLLAERAIVEAKLAHPYLGWVVLPELFTSGYSDLASIHRHAEDAERGASVAFFSSLARSLGLYIAYGFPERMPGTAGAAGVCDSANLVGPTASCSPTASDTLCGRTGSTSSLYRERSFRSWRRTA